MSGAYPPHALQAPKKLSREAIEHELATAIVSATGDRSTRVYSKIAAVLIHFADDDLNCNGLETQLADTLRKFYGINPTRRLLLGSNPYSTIVEALGELSSKGYCMEGSLIILVFSGHGKIEEVKDSAEIRGLRRVLKLGGALDKNGNFRTRELDWAKATDWINETDCDVLHIMDCCYAAEGMSVDAELLAASTETASGDPKGSFTNALIDELRRLSSSPFTISTLYQSLMTNRDALNLECIPFYHIPHGRTSIVLGKSKAKAKVPQLKPDDRRILLTAHVDRALDMRDVECLKKWLSDALPSSIMAMEIKLEGAWDSSSSLLLFSLPITVWAQIDRYSSAYTYVGEVTSNNKLLQQAQGSALAFRPPQGPENRKPGESSGTK